MNDAKQIDVHDPAEIRDVSIAQFADSRDGCVIEHEIETAMPRRGVIDKGLDFRRVGNICPHRFGPSASLSEECSYFLRATVVDISHHDTRSGFSEAFA